MKRNHIDDIGNKHKRFSFPHDRSSLGHSGNPYYAYQPPHMSWGDLRNQHKEHTNMGMYSQPPPHHQGMMMSWNGASPNAQSAGSFSPIYNPLQPPPPPLPLDRPPMDAPPPPPPHNQSIPLRNMNNMNNMNNMRRRPRPNMLRPDHSSFMPNPYKKLNLMQKNGLNSSNHSLHGGGSSNKKGDKLDELDKPKPTLKVNKKARRKPMSERYTCKKEWNREDAIKALTLENAYNHLIKKVPMLILRFPDPELNKNLIYSYSPAIETVHFQQPSRARYCFVQLKPDADIEQVKEEISKITFGTGTISVENKITRHEVAEVTPEQLDPYTLYVGNLPTKLNVTIFKEKFPTAKRIDIGYAQRTKFTRYAFLHYDNVNESMEAFKSTYNLTIDARSLVVRFRRNKGSVGLSEKGKKPKKDDAAETTEGTTKTETPKAPSTATLFNAETDTKANVMKEVEELLRTGIPETNNNPMIQTLFGTRIKEEPTDTYEDNFEDDCASDDYIFNDGFNDGFNDLDDDDDSTMGYDDSDNDSDNNDSDLERPAQKRFGKRHWERSDHPVVKFKEEKPDDYLDSSAYKSSGSLIADRNKQKEDELDELYRCLNPEEDDFEF